MAEACLVEVCVLRLLNERWLLNTQAKTDNSRSSSRVRARCETINRSVVLPRPYHMHTFLSTTRGVVLRYSHRVLLWSVKNKEWTIYDLKKKHYTTRDVEMSAGGSAKIFCFVMQGSGGISQQNYIHTLFRLRVWD